MVSRLERFGVEPESVTAVLITHEHADHVGGAAQCAARFGWAIHASHGTAAAAGQLSEATVRRFDSHTSFAIEDLQISPFPVPHDAREPTQFVIGDGAVRLGVLTDVGRVTSHIVEMLKGCEGLVLECNHDLEMLARGRYPPKLKKRISGDFGHLDNHAAANLLREVADSRLQHVVAAHLSAENNTPDLARKALLGVLACDGDRIQVAGQEVGVDWVEIH